MKKLILALVLGFATHAFAQAAPDVNKTVEIGTPVTLQFISADGTAPFTFQWQKNGVNIAGATGNILSMQPTTQNSAGVYTVVVTNAKGSTTSNKLNLSITITIAPSNAVAGFGL